MPAFRMSKVKEYPKPHYIRNNFQLSADDTLRAKSAVHIPICHSDEGMDPTVYNANPRHASFAEYRGSNCCSQSKVFGIRGSLLMDFTKGAWNTDKLRNLKVMVIPIAISFVEDLTPTDDRTTSDIALLLSLASESTDRQTYPVYNNTTLNGASVDMGSDAVGLTATTALEGVTFDMQQLYDALKYYTNRGKLSAIIGKIKWFNLSMNRVTSGNVIQSAGSGTINFNINLPSKAKAMNPNTYFGFLIYLPQLGTEHQYGLAADTSAIDHVHISVNASFNEWNHEFKMESV